MSDRDGDWENGDERERDTGQRQCTGTSSEIFELNPKTKWKLLISLALILLSAPLRFHSVLSSLFSSIYICTVYTRRRCRPFCPNTFFWDEMHTASVRSHLHWFALISIVHVHVHVYICAISRSRFSPLVGS